MQKNIYKKQKSLDGINVIKKQYVAELIENDLPPYLIGDSDIDPKFVNIQKIYDSLYLDDGKEFKYIGFKEAEKRENFFRELLLVINLLMIPSVMPTIRLISTTKDFSASKVVNT